jgi:hypothetical protein
MYFSFLVLFSDYWVGAEMTDWYIWTHTKELVRENLWKKLGSAEKGNHECVVLCGTDWELKACDRNGVDNYVCEKDTTTASGE